MSVAQASLLTAKAGFSGVFIAGTDYADVALREASGTMEGVWRPSAHMHGSAADTFVGILSHHQHEPPHERGCNGSSMKVLISAEVCGVAVHVPMQSLPAVSRNPIPGT